MVDEVPPWLRANFNAAGQLVDLVALETAPKTTDGNECFGNHEECFRRRTIAPAVVANGRIRNFAHRVRQLLSDIKPDVVVTLGWSGAKNLAALSWCTTNQVPSVVATDSNEHDFRRGKVREAIKRRVVGSYSVGWAAGSAAKKYLRQLGMRPERIVVGPVDTIDVEHFEKGAAEARRHPKEARRELGVPDEYFLAVSRFAPEKNLLNLIYAYASYRERAGAAAWKLVLVGDGPMISAIQRHIGNSHLDGWVHLPGWITFEKLPAYYGLASAFVHASTRETWGVVVNEAMAAGLPIIVSNRCGSASELVDNGRNGFVFNPRDVAGLADILNEVAHGKCDRARLGRISSETIQDWTPHRYASSLREVVTVAQSNQPRRPKRLDVLLLTCLAQWQHGP